MGVPIKYTDEEIIEWMKPFKTRSEIRAFDMARYQLIMRRPSLREHLPIKLTKDGNVVGTYKVTLEERRELKALNDTEKQRVRQEKKDALEAKKLLGKSRKKRQYSLNMDGTQPKHMYNCEQLENGNIICGRCFEESIGCRENKSICKVCYNRYMYHRGMDQDHNKWNIRDMFCNSVIEHHEKKFIIGIRVDERTQNYLTLVGYSFLFKECYDEEKFRNKVYKN